MVMNFIYYTQTHRKTAAVNNSKTTPAMISVVVLKKRDAVSFFLIILNS